MRCILGKEVLVGSNIVGIPQTNFIVLYTGVVLELRDGYAIVAAKLPPDILDGRVDTLKWYYDNMAVVD